MSSPIRKRQKFNRASKACTTCRTKKLRCDGVAKFPGSCTQCVKANRLCEMDVSYKLSKNHHHTATASSYNSGVGSVSHTSSEESNKSGTATPENPAFNFTFLHQNLNKVFPSDFKLPIGDTGKHINGQTIWAMFRAFYNYYYPHLPIFTKEFLDPHELTFNDDKKLCFWALCTITSPQCAPGLRDSLIGYTKDLIYKAQTLGTPMNITHCLTNILSLLLLCYWPPIYHSTKEDDTWLYSGRAMFLAMQLGLHQNSPFYIEPKSDERKRITISAMTWAGCFVISQMTSGMLGLPCVAPVNKRLYRVLNKIQETHPIIVPFYEQLKLLHSLRDSIDALGNSSDTDSGLVDPSARGAVHSSVSTSFSHLASTIQTQSPFTELVFLSGKIYLHSFLLAPDTLEKDRKGVALPLATVLIKAISTCHQVTDSAVVRSIPIYFIRLLVFSSSLLFGITIDGELAPQIDMTACRNSISEAYQLLAKLTSEKGDLCSTGMALIDGLQEMHTLNLIKQPVFHISSRLGSNGFMSLLVTYKRYKLQYHQMSTTTNITPPVDPEGPLEDTLLKMFQEPIWDWDLQPFIQKPL